tara:strand:- start:896 stop:1045 length:150 start_codon:yes stop_codon:yes gene_type:complete
MVPMFHSLFPGPPAKLSAVANYALPYSEQLVVVGATPTKALLVSKIIEN